MEFETQQLVIFVAILGVGLALALVFTIRAVFLAWRAAEKKSRFDWILATIFGLWVLLFVGFQLYRVIIRF